MDFGLTDAQRLLRDSLHRYLSDTWPLETVRARLADGNKACDKLDEGLVELGVLQALVPERHGGLALGVLDAALIQQMLGRFVVPTPYTGRAALAALALRSAGNEAQQARWLPALIAGEARFCVGLGELSGRRTAARLQVTDGQLQGACLFALDATDATHAIVAVADGSLQLADLAHPGVQQVPLASIDPTRSVAELRFEAVPCEPLGAAGARPGLAGELLTAGRVLLAADTLGAAEAMLEQAVQYAGQRRQFGRTIASFQAVKHLCADMAARLEPCVALVWYAAHASDAGLADAPLMACLAKSHLGEVGQFVARTAIEVHGGMGFTELAGLHLWFKRIGLDRQLLGGPTQLRAEASRLQGHA